MWEGLGMKWNGVQGSLPWDTVPVDEYHGVGWMHVGGGFVSHLIIIIILIACA